MNIFQVGWVAKRVLIYIFKNKQGLQKLIKVPYVCGKNVTFSNIKSY